MHYCPYCAHALTAEPSEPNALLLRYAATCMWCCASLQWVKPLGSGYASSPPSSPAPPSIGEPDCGCRACVVAEQLCKLLSFITCTTIE
eukprot:1161469-Pelagomonas_calceolata.AAC.22